jgi:hypothetical protein
MLQILANQNQTNCWVYCYEFSACDGAPQSIDTKLLSFVNKHRIVYYDESLVPLSFRGILFTKFFKILPVLVGFRQLVVRAGTWSLGGTSEMSFFPVSCKEIRNMLLTINYEYGNIY